MIDIVMLSGPQGSGKSTTAEALFKECSRLGYQKRRILKFADPLYMLHDFILNRMERFNGIKRVKKDGVLMQLLGTEWGRQVFGPNVWSDILKQSINELVNMSIINPEMYPPGKVLIIVDDCRFENEFDAFPEALRVRLNAYEAVRKKRTESWREKTSHASETGLDAYAAQGKFDLYLRTDEPESSPEHCATLIFAQLQKRSWPEKRKNPEAPKSV